MKQGNIFGTKMFAIMTKNNQEIIFIEVQNVCHVND